nr:hypothetical protein [Tanacetum cinerariifolium]
MVNIPDDEDLVDYDGDDEEPKEESEEEPEEELEEEPEQEPEQQIGHGNQFAQHPNPQPGNMKDLEDDVEWIMAPVTPPRAIVTVSSTYEVGGPSTAAIEGPSFPLPAPGLHSTYEVGGPSTAAIEGPSFPLPAPGLHVPPTVIEDLSTRLGNLEYRHGVLMRKIEEVQVMESQAVQVVSELKEIETKVQKVESRVDTYSSGQLAMPGQDEIIGLSQKV